MPEPQEPTPPETPTPTPVDQASRLSQNPSMQPLSSNPAPQSQVPQRLPYWLQQAERFLRVIVRIYLGLLVCFAPWYPPAWDANPLFSQSPWLMNFITYGAVRGIVSGLGLLNLWIALRDVLRNPADPTPR